MIFFVNALIWSVVKRTHLDTDRASIEAQKERKTFIIIDAGNLTVIMPFQSAVDRLIRAFFYADLAFCAVVHYPRIWIIFLIKGEIFDIGKYSGEADPGAVFRRN